MRIQKIPNQAVDIPCPQPTPRHLNANPKPLTLHPTSATQQPCTVQRSPRLLSPKTSTLTPLTPLLRPSPRGYGENALHRHTKSRSADNYRRAIKVATDTRHRSSPGYMEIRLPEGHKTTSLTHSKAQPPE